MALQHLVEGAQGNLATLQHIIGEERTVDVFPLVAELPGQVRVETVDALAVNLVQAERGLGPGPAHARLALLLEDLLLLLLDRERKLGGLNSVQVTQVIIIIRRCDCIALPADVFLEDLH